MLVDTESYPLNAEKTSSIINILRHVHWFEVQPKLRINRLDTKWTQKFHFDIFDDLHTVLSKRN